MKAGIIIGHLSNEGNEGSLIRTAEALGINNVFVIGKKRNDYGSSMGADRHVNFYEFQTEENLINYLLKNNYSLICIENINDEKDISEIFRYPKNPVFCTGNENTGIPKALLSNAKLRVKLNQGQGYSRCFNTTIAGSIVLYDFFKKHIDCKTELWNQPNKRVKK